MLVVLALVAAAGLASGCEDQGLPEGLDFKDCAALKQYGLCDAFPTRQSGP